MFEKWASLPALRIINLEAVGTTIDEQFVIDSVLGAGGYGVVYKARQITLDRLVALKMLNTCLGEKDEIRQRFEREAVTLAKLKHRNLVMFYGTAVWHKQRYMYMEYVQGTTLHQLLQREKRLPADRAISIVSQVLDGLGCAHSNGVLHRDLKPTNVMLVDRDGEEVVKIIDFGLAKILADDRQSLQSMQLTQDGMAVGTKSYMSPEQISGGVQDLRSDLYAVGCLLQVCLTGLSPFDDANSIAILLGHLNNPPRPLADVLPSGSFPAGLQSVLNKALCKDPAQRYQSAAEMSADLRLLLDDPEAKIKDTPAPFRFNQSRSSKLLWPAAAILLMVISVSIGFYVRAPHGKSVRRTSIELYREGKQNENANNVARCRVLYAQAIESRETDGLIDDKWAAEICANVCAGYKGAGQEEKAMQFAGKGVSLWFRQSRAAGDSLVGMTNVFLDSSLARSVPREGIIFAENVARRCGPTFWQNHLISGTRKSLSAAFIRAGMPDPANMVMSEIIVSPTDPPKERAEELWRKGWINRLNSNHLTSRKCFSDGIKLYRNNGDLYVGASAASIDLNDWVGAERFRQDFQKQFPDQQTDDTYALNGLLAAHKGDWWTARHQFEWITDINVGYPCKVESTLLGWAMRRYAQMCKAANQKDDYLFAIARLKQMEDANAKYIQSLKLRTDLPPS